MKEFIDACKSGEMDKLIHICLQTLLVEEEAARKVCQLYTYFVHDFFLWWLDCCYLDFVNFVCTVESSCFGRII